MIYVEFQTLLDPYLGPRYTILAGEDFCMNLLTAKSGKLICASPPLIDFHD